MKRSLAILSLCVFLLPLVAEHFHVHEHGHEHGVQGSDTAKIESAAFACLLCKLVRETLSPPEEVQRAFALPLLTCTVPAVLPASVVPPPVGVPSQRGPPFVA